MSYNQLQIASRLKISRVYVARLIREGKLQAKKVGRSYKVSQKSLEKFLGAKFNQKFYTLKEVATLLNLHRTFVSKLIYDKKLQAVKIGRFFIIPENELKQLLQTEIPEKTYTIAQLSKISGSARTNIVRSIRASKLRAIKLENEYRIAEKDAKEYLQIPLV